MDSRKKAGLSFETTAGFKLAEQILNRANIESPELEAPPPRKFELRKELDHKHGVSIPLMVLLGGVLLGFAYLCVLTYTTHHELPIPSIALILCGIGLLAFALMSRTPAGCDCKWQQELVKNGTAVVGQITDKRVTNQADGSPEYELDYAFQPQKSDESHWGRMRVTEQQFNALDEGDDVTVLYCQLKSEVVSRLYSFCDFRAIKE